MLDLIAQILELLALVMYPVGLGRLVHRTIFGEENLTGHSDGYYAVIGFIPIVLGFVLVSIVLVMM